MAVKSPNVITVPQPDGDPIVLDNDFDAADQYKAATRYLKGDGEPVADHILATVVHNANSKHVSNEDVAQIAHDFQVADQIVREMPNVPIIYSLHCEEAVAVTPETGTEGFRLVDVNKGKPDRSPYFLTTVPARKQISHRTGANIEAEGEVTEDAALQMHQPLSFLVSGAPEALKRFQDYHPEWMRYPNAHVVVGSEAVDAFLHVQVHRDLASTDREADPKEIKDSWALLASAGLRRLGYASPIGRHGDFAHRVAIEGLADVVASTFGYEAGAADLRHDGQDGMVMRRLAGIDFDPAKDVPIVGRKATERILSDEEKTGRFAGVPYKDEGQVESYLTETAGRFVEHFLAIETV